MIEDRGYDPGATGAPPAGGGSASPPLRLGLPIAALVLGILAVVLSFLLVGAALGAAGLILGIVHLKSRRGPYGMAWWGVGLSAAGLILGIWFGTLYYRGYQEVRKAMAAREGRKARLKEWKGVPAPDFTVTAIDGKKITLSELKGRRVVLDFWATWCPPCRKEVPHFVRLAKEISPSDLRIVGISREDEGKLKAFAEREGINYPLASAEDLPEPYSSVRSIPTTFFIDRNGIIQDIATGYHGFEGLKLGATEKDYAGAPKAPPDAGAPREADGAGTE